jgi:supervillin
MLDVEAPSNEETAFAHSDLALFNSPHLFLLTSLYGHFEAREILNPLRSSKPCPYPFYQFQLYEEKQPALFLFDNMNELYIWQGWFESHSVRSDSTIILNETDATDGSAKIRFNINRKCALQTAINYWREKYGQENMHKFKGYIVYAGLEPVEFQNLYPYWEVNETAKECNVNVNYFQSSI